MSNLAGILGQLHNPSDIALSFRQGMQTGQAQREEREVRGALAAYATNPADPKVFTTLAQYRPELAIKLRENSEKKQKELETQRLTGLAATGDRTALAKLAGIDLDAFDKLNDNEVAAAKVKAETLGQAALVADTPEKWDQQIDRLAGMGMDFTKYKGRFDLRDGALAQAGLIKQFVEMNEPKYQAVPYEADLVNTSDPAAVNAFIANRTGSGAGQGIAAPTSKAEFDALPPGATFKAPDGTMRTKPGGGGSNATGSFRG